MHFLQVPCPPQVESTAMPFQLRGVEDGHAGRHAELRVGGPEPQPDPADPVGVRAPDRVPVRRRLARGTSISASRR